MADSETPETDALWEDGWMHSFIWLKSRDLERRLREMTQAQQEDAKKIAEFIIEQADKQRALRERAESAERARDEAQRDAERYRWLRDKSVGHFGAKLDEAIDTAIDSAIGAKERKSDGNS